MDYSILGSMLGFPHFGKVPYACREIARVSQVTAVDPPPPYWRDLL